MLGASRLLLLIFAALLAGGGIVAIATQDPGAVVVGVILIACAVPLAIGAAYERIRYRSNSAEAATTPSGPGGEPTAAPLEPRFRATDEVFVDPSSGTPMRVYLDPATGERRYRAEG